MSGILQSISNGLTSVRQMAMAKPYHAAAALAFIIIFIWLLSRPASSSGGSTDNKAAPSISKKAAASKKKKKGKFESFKEGIGDMVSGVSTAINYTLGIDEGFMYGTEEGLSDEDLAMQAGML